MIPPLVQQALQNLLLALLGDLASVVGAFIKQAQQEAKDDPTIGETIDKIVREITDQHADLSWEDKFIRASEIAMSYFGEIGKDFSRAFVNTVISAKILEIRQNEAQPSDAQKTTGIQNG